jgi:type VI secretion system protein ImpH
MAAESGRTDPSLKQQLFQEGYRFEFFQAVRLLQRGQTTRQSVGGASRPSDEAVRFRAHQSLSFPPSEIYELRETEAAERPPEMTVAFMGLTGPMGILPRYYTELMLDRIRAKDYTLRDFFDVLNHRLISLFYRAWEKHRIVVGCERSFLRGGKDTFADDLFALMGMGTKGLREQLLLPERTLLRYTGLLVSRRHSADALRQCLADYFEVPVYIQQFIGQWYQLAEQDWSRLGLEDGNNRLGQTSVVGTKVWDQQARFRVKLGPLDYETYRGLLPSGTAYPVLVQLTKCFAGAELDFDLNLVLKAADVPYCRLAQVGTYQPQLGWTTWLQTRPAIQNAEEVVFSGSTMRYQLGTA